MVAELLAREWASVQIVSRGELYDASSSSALLCLDGERVVGLVTYEPGDAAWQILTLNAFERRRGIGSGLLNAVVDEAASRGARRVWLVTSNDNLDALRFYQRRGMRLAAVHAGALDEARRLLKPSLPEVGDYGIAVRDEIELEIRLGR